MRESFSRSMTKHLVEEFTLNIMIKHAVTSAHAVPLIRSAYELTLASARAIDTILACPKKKSQAIKGVELEVNAVCMQA